MTDSILTRPVGIILLAVFVAAAFFTNIGGYPLFDEDEGAYTAVTREMLEKRDLLTPRLDGKPFFHKPPFFYWCQAISVSLFGMNEFAFRLPSAIAALMWAGCIFLFVERQYNRQTAWFAAFFLATAIQINIVARAAIPDAFLNLFICLTMFAFYTHFKTGRRLPLIVAFACMGLGFLTKGPIAILIPLVSLTLFYASLKRTAFWMRTLLNPLAWMVFLAVTLPWYVALYALYGYDFIHEIFLVHNVDRFLSPMEGHSGSVLYYVPVILAGLVPYSTLLIGVFADLKNQWRDDLGRFLLLWFAFVFIFFSLAGTKLHHYILYGYVPLLILMAEKASSHNYGRWLFIPPILFVALLWLLPWIVPLILPHIADEFARIVAADAVLEFGRGFSIIMGLAVATIIVVGVVKRIDQGVKVIVFGLLLIVILNGYLVPKAAGILQAPIKTAALTAREKGLDVIMWKMYYPSFGVYLGRPALRTAPRPGDIIITKIHRLKRVKSHEPLFEAHGIVLTRVIEMNP
jgi:4-amino-4-deoxy-L-arabinose transferase-like glycosyltransferase